MLSSPAVTDQAEEEHLLTHLATIYPSTMGGPGSKVLPLAGTNVPDQARRVPAVKGYTNVGDASARSAASRC